MGNKEETFFDQTLKVWQPRTCRQLSPEDARQIVENVTGFFDLLLKWETSDDEVSSNCSDTSTPSHGKRKKKSE